MEGEGKPVTVSDSLLSCQSRLKNRMMTNIFLTISDEETRVNFVKDSYDKTNKLIKNRERKYNFGKVLSVLVCKTLCEYQRTQHV